MEAGGPGDLDHFHDSHSDPGPRYNDDDDGSFADAVWIGNRTLSVVGQDVAAWRTGMKENRPKGLREFASAFTLLGPAATGFAFNRQTARNEPGDNHISGQ